jgi:hypothetical protein
LHFFWGHEWYIVCIFVVEWQHVCSAFDVLKKGM